MTKIYLVRHCEAVGNRLRLFQGHTDTDISENGAKQLKYLAERFRDVHIDKVISSPLIRAKKTALAVAEPKNLPVEIDEDFIEMYCGVTDGAHFDYIFSTYPKMKYCWYEEPQNFEPEGGESMRALYKRALSAIKKVAADPENNGKTIYIATHGGLLRCLHCALLHDDIEKLKEVAWSLNTAVTLLSCENDQINIEYLGDASHVPEKLLPKSSRILSK